MSLYLSIRQSYSIHFSLVDCRYILGFLDHYSSNLESHMDISSRILNSGFGTILQGLTNTPGYLYSTAKGRLNHRFILSLIHVGLPFESAVVDIPDSEALYSEHERCAKSII